MISAKKRYAVFIPCYNAAGTIKETIESVQQAIEFTELPIPAFIYDDCSKDNSFAVVSELIKNKPAFHHIKNQINSGERKTTNQAFNTFHGKFDWVFIIHADDIVKKDWLTTLIAQIEQVDDGNCFTVWSSYDTLIDKTNGIEPGDNSNKVQCVKKDIGYVRQSLTKVTSSWHISGSALNVKLYLQLKGFDEGMPQFGDTVFIAKGILAGYSDVYICRTLMMYRISDTSVTSTSYKTNRDIREIYMLIDMYEDILTQSDKLKMYRLVINWTSKRMIKWLLKKKIRLAFLNFKQFNQSLIRYFYIKVSKKYSG